ncbi:efflux RND transporter permease subunit [Planktosalinus lacus]|uniref:Copper transporter n=1 Tax=Planktosalinus lacus TaxID=1526573 RepID=A0A8J2V801_9FLAO|nr:efflux RND transporter permease subunit [Planktosalinus lacus]GGD82499.1 copper transporter [Planktosalinus lacus]
MAEKKIKYFGLSNWSINNKMTVFVLIAIITFGGLMSYLNLPRESFPEVIENKVYVSSLLPGNSAEDVERRVTKPLEEEINDISGVVKVTSNSLQDYSMITVEFEESITIQDAKTLVKDKVDAVKALQDWPTLDGGVKVEPNVFDLNISEIMPIAQLNLKGDYTQEQLKKFAEDLQDRLEEFTEVKEATLLGVQDKEVEVAVDMYKMMAAEVSFNQIIGAIQDENTTISGGNIIENGMRRNIRVIGEIENPSELEGIVVKEDEGAVYLRDIATINFRPKDATTFAREYGKPVVMLSIKKKGGENMISAMEKIKEHIPEALGTYLPDDLEITITSDQSTRTKDQVAELENSIIFGVILVISVLMFFLGFRNALFVGIAIPLSILLSFLLLPIAGDFSGVNLTLNTMVLFATVMGLGMLVDNGIVVVENVYRLMDEGMPRMEAAKQGVGEIAWPIIASTATTLAAFLPLGFWPGIMGKFMIFFPMTLSVVLFSSLFVALVINAMLTSTLMKTQEDVMSRKTIVKISGALFGFGLLLLISGLLDTHIIFKVLGPIILIVSLIQIFIGWKNRTKTALLRKGLGVFAVGILFTILGYVGGPKALVGFGNLFIFVSISLWFFKYMLIPASKRFQFKTLPKIEKHYQQFLDFALKGSNAYRFFFGTVGLLGLAFLVFGLFTPQVLFFPENQPNQAIVYIEYPEGTAIEKTNELTKIVEQQVFDVLEKYQYQEDGETYNYMAESIISQVGEGAGNPMTDGASQNEMPHRGKVTVLFREYKYRFNEEGDKVSSSDVLTEIREAVQGHPGVSIIAEKDQAGPPAGYAINIELKGEDYFELIDEARNIQAYIDSQNIPGIEDLNLDVNQNKPEMEVVVDRMKAGELGVSTAQVGQALRSAIYGFDASTYKEGDDDHDIVVRFDGESRYDENALFNQNITFRDNKGVLKQIPLSTLVTTKNLATFSSIKRKDLKRVITIYSNVLEGFNPTETVQKIETSMVNYPLPKEMTYAFTGEQEEMAKNMEFLSGALVIALFLILLIIVGQFNSISKPIMIFAAIVLSFIGVLFGLVIFQMDFVVLMTMMGIISLAGIVVNNAIVLIDYTQLLIDRKKDELDIPYEQLLTREQYREVIIAAGTNRLRPVLLTAITTILGLLPLAVGLNLNFFTLFTEFDPQIYIGGDNNMFWKPMSWTIIFGLTFATFLTLVIIPTMFYLLNRAKIRFDTHKNETKIKTTA